MELVLDGGLDVVGRESGSVTQGLALGRLGVSSRSTKVADASRGGAARGHGSGLLDGQGLAHDGALLGHVDEAIGSGGGLCRLLGERAKGRRGGVSEERTGSGSEFHGE